MAAATKEGISMTPIDQDKRETKALLTATNILLHEFRSVVGCSTLKANINHKLDRLHYIRTTPQLAQATAAQQKKYKNANFRSDHHSWFNSIHDSGTYDAYFRYRNLKPRFGDTSPHTDLSAYVV